MFAGSFLKGVDNASFASRLYGEVPVGGAVNEVVVKDLGSPPQFKERDGQNLGASVIVKEFTSASSPMAYLLARRLGYLCFVNCDLRQQAHSRQPLLLA